MSKQQIILWIVGAVIVGGLIWWGNQQRAEDAVIKIGIATILSGDLAALGENVVNTAQLAVDDINNAGGIDGKRVRLVVENAQCDSQHGLSAAQKLVNVDGIRLIIGATCSNGTLAAAPFLNEQKVVYLTPVTGGSNVDNAGEYVFRTANADVLAGRDIAEAMLEEGYRKVAAVAEVTEYTADIQQSFIERVKDRGGTAVINETFQPGEADFRTTIAKVRQAQPDAILIASQTGISAAHFVKQLRELGIDIPLFSDFTFIANADAQEIVGSFEGIYFADPAYDADKQALQQFFARYEEEYGKSPFIPFHSAATYDAVQMLAAAVAGVGEDGEAVHDWLLTNVKDWEGFMGTYSLDERGNSDIGFDIKRVVNGAPVPL
ncbi:MAG TPA: ABC transporter substrate-binding protein [Methylophilaceae bacterium]|nr:ABC transporter substrate-binding protein [Methylophilaceae bacterium]